MNFDNSGGTTFYIRESAGVKEYSVDNSTWLPIIFPVFVNNITALQPNPTVLKVEFTTNITLTDVNDYFVCISSYIQFGSSSLKNDGTLPVITILVNNYDGLIANGDDGLIGNSNIYVYNLSIVGTGSLQEEAGWLCKKWFGHSSNNNFIINCICSGDTNPLRSGGLLGSYSGANSDAQLRIIGCSFSGTIGNYRGGIVGGYAGYNGGNVVCNSCYSTGNIGIESGGIFGPSAGIQGGFTSASKCYSTGQIQNVGAGGIYGANAANPDGTAITISSYSKGNVTGIFSGGIYGQNANVSPASSTNATNCYSTGILSGFGSRGIYGNQDFGQAVNCYIGNGSFITSTANTLLTGIPITSNVGTIWIKTAENQPYELNNFGYTPYSVININTSGTPSLIQNFSQNVIGGSSTIPAIISGKSYQILGISQDNTFGSYPTISIDSTTGIITTTSNTSTGLYTIYIRNTDYSVTQVDLTVTNNNNYEAFYIWLLLLLRRIKTRKQIRLFR